MFHQFEVMRKMSRKMQESSKNDYIKMKTVTNYIISESHLSRSRNHKKSVE